MSRLLVVNSRLSDLILPKVMEKVKKVTT